MGSCFPGGVWIWHSSALTSFNPRKVRIEEVKNVAVQLECELGNKVTNLQGFIFAHAPAIKEFSFLSDLEASVFLVCLG